MHTLQWKLLVIGRDAFGLHMGPAGAVVHVFVMRSGKVMERVELAANEGISGSAAEILQASVEQFYQQLDLRMNMIVGLHWREYSKADLFELLPPAIVLEAVLVVTHSQPEHPPVVCTSLPERRTSISSTMRSWLWRSCLTAATLLTDAQG